MMLRYCIEKPEAAERIKAQIEKHGEKCFIMKNGSGYPDGRVIDIPSGYEYIVSLWCRRYKSKYS